jgi:hypothetical protein
MLAAKLKEIKNEIYKYNWKIIESPVALDGDSNFEKNISLKENLSKDVNLEAHFAWIVNTWGGIKNFNVNKSENRNKIQKFLFYLEKNKELPKSLMDVISSLSKIASFKNPKKYCIYDSRAIFSLNWLLIKYSDTNLLFPQPKGRGLSTEIDVSTLLKFTKKEYSWYSEEIAYYKYCELMEELTFQVFEESNKPYYTEMLLFVIAETNGFINQDLRKSVKVIIE